MKRERNSTLICALAALMFASGSGVSNASEENNALPALIDREFTVALGGFFPRIQSTVTLKSPR